MKTEALNNTSNITSTDSLISHQIDLNLAKAHASTKRLYYKRLSRKGASPPKLQPYSTKQRKSPPSKRTMPATFVMSNPTRRKRVRTTTRNPELAQYRRKHLGINTDLSADQRIGEFEHDNPDQVQQRPDTGQTHCNPSSTELRTRGFGKPSKDHSFTVEASGEAILILLFKSRMLDEATET